MKKKSFASAGKMYFVQFFAKLKSPKTVKVFMLFKKLFWTVFDYLGGRSLGFPSERSVVRER